MIQAIAERQGEVAPEQIMENFRQQYLERKEPYHFLRCRYTDINDKDTHAELEFEDHGARITSEAEGNGPIDAVKNAFMAKIGRSVRVLDYSEHALQSGSQAQAAAYIHLMDEDSGKVTYGVGISSNITRASIRALFCAVNRLS